MLILAFDCAGAQCAAAIAADDRILATRSITAERGHAQLLVPLLSDLLAGAGIGFDEITRFAVTTGPGSFTGIRVALATARGFALATGKPVVGVTTFEAFAAAATGLGFPESRLLVAVESRRAECFVQIFDARGRASGEPAMLAPEAIAEWAGPGALALTGDAAVRVAPHLNAAATLDSAQGVDPAVLAKIVARRAPGPPPSPFYLRPPDAVPARVR